MTFSMVCLSVTGSSITWRISKVAREENPEKLDAWVRSWRKIKKTSEYHNDNKKHKSAISFPHDEES